MGSNQQPNDHKSQQAASVLKRLSKVQETLYDIIGKVHQKYKM